MKYITPHLSKRRSKDIVAFDANNVGDDYILGDLHGNLDLLEQASAGLDRKDRLFLLGNLINRGNQSAILLHALINRSPRLAQVIAIAGYHEILTVNAIRGILYLLDNTRTDHLDMLQTLKFRMIDAIDANQSDSDKAKAAFLTTYRLDPDHHKNAAFYRALSSIFRNFRKGGEWLLDVFITEVSNKILMTDESFIKKILNYMLSLPYIIHVAGNDQTPPFHLVHADMPFDDSTLQKRLNGDSHLTTDEIKYSVLARCYGIKRKPHKIYLRDNGRTEASIIAYTGGNLVNNTTKYAVRRGTNTVNLNVGIHYEEVGILYCATDNEYLFKSSIPFLNTLTDNDFLAELKPKQARKFQIIAQALENKYQLQQHLVGMYRRLRKCGSKEVDAIIYNTAVNMSNPDETQDHLEYRFVTLYEFAIHNKAVEAENRSDDLNEVFDAFDSMNLGSASLSGLSIFAVQNAPVLTESDITNRFIPF